jgi:hypothetical protein
VHIGVNCIKVFLIINLNDYANISATEGLNPDNALKHKETT